MCVGGAEPPKLPGITGTMEQMIASNEIAGAMTVVVNRDRILHMQGAGFADVAGKRPMRADTIFWIASMTKPVTAVAILMLQDEGKLNVSDPVSKYIPQFAELKTPSGKPANLTITQILTHTSGLGEAPRDKAATARTLAELVPLWLDAPMQFEPGAKWQYCQSGINAAGRIVEILSGMPFDVFLQKRLFDPLGMKDTTFYPGEEQRRRLVTAYSKDRDSGELKPVPPREDFGSKDRPPQGNGGLFSTAPDYARFCQMLLNRGSLDGQRYLTTDAMKYLSTPQTPDDMPTGFFQSDRWGDHGENYGWALGTCVLKQPHEGVAEALSPGAFGHGGAWGTQAWIDPAKQVAYILMVQRSNFPNSDASEVRRAFQKAASKAIAGDNKQEANTPPVFELRKVSDRAGADTIRMELERNGHKEILNVSKNPVLTTADVAAAATQDDPLNGTDVVVLKFTPDGAERLAEVTADSIDKQLAVLLNGKLVSAPIVKQPITGGSVQISANSKEGAARELVRKINDALEN